MPRRLPLPLALLPAAPGRLALAALACALAAPAARADDIPCGPVDSDVIRVDGLLDDWEDVAGIELGGRGADFSATVRCNYDKKTLYLVVDVRDDYLVRTKAAGATEDHVELAFVDRGKLERLVIHPGDGKVPRKVRWASGRPLKAVEVADALQPGGYAIELRMALGAAPGYSAAGGGLKLGVAALDCDSKSRPEVETTLQTSPIDDPNRVGSAEFAEARASLDAFLRERKLSPSDVAFDRVGRVLPTGTGRVLVAGRTLAVVGDEYAYLELPVARPKDIFDIRLVDLAGDGHDAVLVRYRETGGGGSRDLLAAYRVTGDGLRRTFAVEVAKAQGASKLETKISFVRRKAATDILVEALPAVGWTEAAYHEAPADDAVPILLPWGSDKRARFTFKGEEYSRAE